MKVTILRGISGSGKSTFAKENYPSAVVCSADDYFMVDGEYKFDFTKLSQAHGTCFKKAAEALEFGQDVVVDNTNTQVWEMSPYVLLAQSYNAEIEIVLLDCPASVAAVRNCHGVPTAAVEGMAERMEDPLPFWPTQRIIPTL